MITGYTVKTMNQTWVQVHLRVLKYITSTLVAMLSKSTSTIVENDNVLKYCVKYFKQYLKEKVHYN